MAIGTAFHNIAFRNISVPSKKKSPNIAARGFYEKFTTLSKTYHLPSFRRRPMMPPDLAEAP